MGWAILNAAGLSFLGLGIRPPSPEWGIMVSEGAAYIISGEWWLFVFPGALLLSRHPHLLAPRRCVARLARPEAAHEHRRDRRAAPRPVAAQHPLRAPATVRRRSTTSASIWRAARSSPWSARAGRASRWSPTPSPASSRPAARITAEALAFGGVDLLAPKGRGWRGPARPRDRHRLPEPARGAQPGADRRPADRRRHSRASRPERRAASAKPSSWRSRRSAFPSRSCAPAPIRASSPAACASA